MSRWFRWYEQTCEDGKFRTVARLSRVTVRDVIALWAFILEDAASLDHRGVCERNEDYMAAILDFADGEVERILGAMDDVGLISVGHGAITVTKWKERQFESDTDPTAAERQRRKRERDKEVTNEPVTRDSRSPDTEADTEKKDIIRASAKTRVEETTDEFQIWYDAYPLHKGRGAALRAYRSARKKADADVLLSGAKAAAKKFAGADKQFIPYPATWLNGEHWLNEDLQPPKPQEPISNGGVYVLYGTDAGDAWERHYRLKGKVPPRDSRGGWYHPAEYPENVSLKQSEEEAA